MKQESTNSFNGGLVSDLNVLTTPNNVLTDCINGTFVTFNGDELTLQNDMGNTTIKYNNEDIQLSPGFYPLGIKEYGGVLYIISGMDALKFIPEFIEGTTAQMAFDSGLLEGSIFKVGDNYYTIGAKIGSYPHFTNIVSGNTDEELENNIRDITYALYISDPITYSLYKYKDKTVEFGSYPSPEFGSLTSYLGTTITENNLLYKTKVINNTIFQSGEYINFNIISNIDTTFISYYNLNWEYFPLFYKIKLYHQLNNGFKDLTDDVWNKYKVYKTANPAASNYWFNEPGFNYYCPNQYKGKLAISLEIEELNTFKLRTSPTVTYDSDTYTFSFTVTAIGYGSISIPSLYAYLLLDGIQILSATSNVINEVASFSFSLGASTYAEKVITYKIIPNLEVNNITYITPYIEATNYSTYEDFPIEYRNQFIITGNKIISTTLDDVIFELSSGSCDFDTGMRDYSIITLKNSNGQYLDNTLNITDNIHYVFLKIGTSLESGSVLISRFNVVNNYPVMVTNINTTLTESISAGTITSIVVNDSSIFLSGDTITIGSDEFVISSINGTTITIPETSSVEHLSGTTVYLKELIIDDNLEYTLENNTPVNILDSTCSKVRVTISYNITPDLISVTQNGTEIIKSSSGTYNVIPGIDFLVSISRVGFVNIENNICNVSSATTLIFGLIATKFNFEFSGGTPANTWTLTWNPATDVFGGYIPYIYYDGSVDPINMPWVIDKYQASIESSQTSIIIDMVGDEDNRDLFSTYKNISNPEDYCIIGNGYIFDRSYTLTYNL